MGYSFPTRIHVLRGDVPALQVIAAEDGRIRWGPLVRLGKGTELHDFGKFFDYRTLRVRVDGCFYVVFQQDLDKAQKAEIRL